MCVTSRDRCSGHVCPMPDRVFTTNIGITLPKRILDITATILHTVVESGKLRISTLRWAHFSALWTEGLVPNVFDFAVREITARPEIVVPPVDPTVNDTHHRPASGVAGIVEKAFPQRFGTGCPRYYVVRRPQLDSGIHPLHITQLSQLEQLGGRYPCRHKSGLHGVDRNSGRTQRLHVARVDGGPVSGLAAFRKPLILDRIRGPP